jgi:hypothetical protein
VRVAREWAVRAGSYAADKPRKGDDEVVEVVEEGFEGESSSVDASLG